MTNAIQVRDMRGGGWFWAHATVVRDYGPTIGAYGIAIYAVLATYADNAQGEAFPSISTIADTLNCSTRTVRRYIKRLESLGLIRIDPQYRNGAQTSNLYTLLDPPPVTESGVGVSQSQGGGVTESDELDSVNKTQRTTSAHRSQQEDDLRRPAQHPTGEQPGGSRPNLAALHEAAFGLVPSLWIVSTMDDLKEQYGYTALEHAMKTAAEAGKRDIRYVKGILRNNPTGLKEDRDSRGSSEPHIIKPWEKTI